MSRHAQSHLLEELPAGGMADVARSDEAVEGLQVRARPIPRISIQAFCEGPRTAEAVQAAAEDRRLAKTHVSIHMGGVQAAVAHFAESPNLPVARSRSGVITGRPLLGLPMSWGSSSESSVRSSTRSTRE